MSGTTYRVDILYSMRGNAAQGLKDVDRHARSATSSLGGLRSALALVASGAALTVGYKTFIGFNNELEKMKIGLNTVIAMNFHVPFERASKESDKLFETFKKMAAESPATTKDFVEMANMISSGVIQAGLGLKGLENITKGAITASAALGARPDMLALDVQQMLAGTISVKDRYARQLLAGIGVTDHKAFNKKTAKERGDLVTQAFNQPALTQAAKAYETSFSGVTSTLQDNLELALAKAGIPLMKQMTEEVITWNKWLTENPEKVASIVKDIGEGLSEGFGLVKDVAGAMLPILKDVFGVIREVASFVSEHRDVLITTAKALLVYKGVSMASGLVGGVGKGVAGLFGPGGFGGMATAISGVRTNASGVVEGFGSIIGAVPGVVGALGKIAIAGGVLYGLLAGKTESEKKRAAQAEGDVLSGTALFKAIEKKKELEAMFASHGLDPDKQTFTTPLLKSEQEDLMKARADIEKTQVDVLKRAQAAGMISSQILPGGRQMMVLNRFEDLSYYDKSSGAGIQALQDATQALFKMEIERSNATMKDLGDLANTTADVAGRFTGVNTGMQAPGWYDAQGAFHPGVSGARAWFIQRLSAEEAAKQAAMEQGLPEIKAPNVKVDIHKIEVYTDDPDRFVAQAVQSFEEVARNPTQAHDVVRGAF